MIEEEGKGLEKFATGGRVSVAIPDCSLGKEQAQQQIELAGTTRKISNTSTGLLPYSCYIVKEVACVIDGTLLS
jgi:hypothetical protein